MARGFICKGRNPLGQILPGWALTRMGYLLQAGAKLAGTRSPLASSTPAASKPARKTAAKKPARKTAAKKPSMPERTLKAPAGSRAKPARTAKGRFKKRRKATTSRAMDLFRASSKKAG